MTVLQRKKIGALLLEAGLITPAQLEKALVARGGQKKKLGKIMVELGYLSEAEIAEVLSKQLSIPLVQWDDFQAPKELHGLISKEMAEGFMVMPLELQEKTLLVAMADPLDWNTISSLSFMTGLHISVAVTDETSIRKAIECHYQPGERTWDLFREMPAHEGVELEREIEDDREKINPKSLYELSEAPPVVRLVTMTLAEAVKSRASDVHIEPQEKQVQVRYRIDGNLKNVLTYSKRIQDSVVSRIKIKSNLDITNRRLPQDGRSTLRLENRDIDLRISTLPSVHGENVTIRLLDRTAGLISLEQLGIPKPMLTSLLSITSRPQGMILVTGPTGSGKTTTLYALLQQLRTETKSIFTIEDPVEYKIEGLTQVGVNDAVGLGFPVALRSILRQDPDIILVGEVRDSETAEIAFRAALTGHLVLTTLHTNNTVATITRLVDLGLDPYLVNSAITGILAQRLVRRICPACRVEATPPESLLLKGLPPLPKYYQGKGCLECQNSGYRGQIGIYEFLRIDGRLNRLIARGATEDELWETARQGGTVTLFENAWDHVREGNTTVDEILLKIPRRGDESKGIGLQGSQGEKVRLLALDVSESDRYVIHRILKSEGYEVVFANGREDGEATTGDSPDLILLESSGEITKLLRKLRSDVRHAYVPIFVLSDLPNQEIEEKWSEFGAVDFLYRPINPQRLLRTLNRKLQGVGEFCAVDPRDPTMN